MVKVSVDTASLERSLKNFSQKTKKTSSDALLDIAQVGARQLAQVTRPPGLNNGSLANKVLENAVKQDVGEAFVTKWEEADRLKKTSSKGRAHAFLRAAQENDTSEMSKYARNDISGISTQAPKSALDSLRVGHKRRVPSSAKPILALNKDSITSTLKESLKNVGLVKAAFLQAGKSIAAKWSIPGWLRKSDSLGYSSKTSDSITLYNSVSYASDFCSEHEVNTATKRAVRNTLKRYEKIIAKDASKV